MSKSNKAGYDITRSPFAPNLLFNFGDEGSGGIYIPSVTAITGGYRLSWTNDAGLPNPDPVDIMNGTNGTNGQDGTDGQDGENGVTFTPAVTEVTGGVQISWTNDGELPNPQTVTIYNGTNGQDGQDGLDGISPTITARSITGGTQIEIVSAGGTERFDVMDGTDGTDGTTPNITMTATVGTNTGTPSVQVTQTGTAAAPNINLAFDGLKGESGGGSAKDPIVQNVKYTNSTSSSYASTGNVTLGNYTFTGDKLSYGYFVQDCFKLRLSLASSIIEDIKALTSVILVTLRSSGTVKRTTGTSWVTITPYPIAINPGVNSSYKGYCLTKAFRFGDYMVSKCISPGFLKLELAPTTETSTALTVEVPYYADIVNNGATNYIDIYIKSDELKRAFEIITQGDATATAALMAEMETVWDSDWQTTYTNEGSLGVEFRGQA